jgi:hypothetical protein
VKLIATSRYGGDGLLPLDLAAETTARLGAQRRRLKSR